MFWAVCTYFYQTDSRRIRVWKKQDKEDLHQELEFEQDLIIRRFGQFLVVSCFRHSWKLFWYMVYVSRSVVGLLAVKIKFVYLLGCLSCWRGAVRSSKELKAALNAVLSTRFDWQKFFEILETLFEIRFTFLCLEEKKWERMFDMVETIAKTTFEWSITWKQASLTKRDTNGIWQLALIFER